MSRIVLLSLAVLSLHTALPGTPAAHAADKWVSVRSKNFHLVGNASESNIRRVGRDLEEFRAGIALLLPSVNRQASQPITVIVFKDDASFRPFKPMYQGKPANVAGFFQPGRDVNFIALTADLRTPNTIFHEFVHSLTNDITVSFPLWALEGLAEFYEAFEIDSNGKEMLLGRPTPYHVETLRRSFMKVEALFNVRHDSPAYNERTRQGIFYAESWAIVHYLMLGENGKYRPQLARFLELTAANRPVAESFREAFQRDFAAFENELLSYIGRFTFPGIRFTLQNRIDVAKDMLVAPLSDAQVEYYLGDLLRHMERLDVAETHLEKAAALDPGFAPSFAALGMLKLRQDKDEEALKFLARAVQGNSTEHMTHYYYASLLQSAGEKRTGDEDRPRLELMRQHLKKSIELAPGFFNAYDMLGYVSLVLKDELRETENMLKKVLESAPGRSDTRLRLAELMIENEEQQAARIILLPLRTSEDDRIRMRAETLIGYIETYLEDQRAFLAYQERRKELEAAEAAAAAAVEEKVADPLPERPAMTRRERTSSSERIIETAVPQISNRPAGREVTGALVSSDCTKGLTLRVRIGNGNVEFHASDPAKIEFVSYTTSVSDSFQCGTLRNALPVRVIYRVSSDPRYLGEPVRVEFTEQK